MAKRESNNGAMALASLPALPLTAGHWQSIFAAMRLSPKQATVVDLTLRDLSDNRIAEIMGIHKSTVNMHRERIYARTGARTKMQIAMHVLVVSHELTKDIAVG